MTTYAGKSITERRAVRWVPGRSSKVRLRLLDNGLSRLASDYLSPQVFVRAERGMSSELELQPRPSCRSGRTIAKSSHARAFRLVAFGVFACAPGGQAPIRVGEEFNDIEGAAVDHVRAEGRYVAVATAIFSRCDYSNVLLVDAPAARVVRSFKVATAVDNPNRSCTGTARVGALVLRRSGAMAWTGLPGDDGVAVVDAADALGYRRLDASPGIDPRSLRSIDADRVAWARDKQAVAAPLK